MQRIKGLVIVQIRQEKTVDIRMSVMANVRKKLYVIKRTRRLEIRMRVVTRATKTVL